MVGFFEELLMNGEAAIERCIEERQAETLHFDCKLKAVPTTPKPDRNA
ncbi:MAG TPA: hypothetical protein VND19_19535 [Acetobacteraceae bacterium]|nr:hypothetical protein [Acetobacteraceae bacterium]